MATDCSSTSSVLAEGVHRIATYVPEADFTFCQYLVVGEDALLFHTGPSQLAEATLGAVTSIIPADRLRWLSWGHVENDESGAAERVLAAAPHAQVTVGAVGAMLNMFECGGRPVRPLGHGEVIDLGGRRLRWLDTPQVPHGWDAGLFFEEATETLLCGDLFTLGGRLADTTDDDLAVAGLAFEDQVPGGTALTPGLAPAIRDLAALSPRILAPMHAPAFKGNGALLLSGLADGYAARFQRALESATRSS